MNIEEIANTAVQYDKAGQLAQARQLYIQLLKEVKKRPKELMSIKNEGLFGKTFLLMFDQDVTRDMDDFQLIAELAYYFISKEIRDDTLVLNPLVLYDRVIVLFNGEDFIKDTIKEAFDLQLDFSKLLSSIRTPDHDAQDYLNMMRIADFEHKYKIYDTSDFFRQQKIDLDQLIARGRFGRNKSRQEIVSEGKTTHEKVYNYLDSKFNA